MRASHVLTALALFVLATGASFLGRPSRPASPQTQHETDPLAALRGVRNATVRVTTPTGAFGSGFCRRLSDRSVYVWTCAHVINHAAVTGGTGYHSVQVSALQFSCDDQMFGSISVAADVVRVSATTDVALLKLQGPLEGCGALEFAANVPTIWDPVFVCGTPTGLDHTLTRGHFVFRGRHRSVCEYDQVDAPTVGGNSGGPVTTPGGRVIGLVHGGYGESFTFIVPAREIRAFALQENLVFAYEGTAPPTAPVPGPVAP